VQTCRHRTALRTVAIALSLTLCTGWYWSNIYATPHTETLLLPEWAWGVLVWAAWFGAALSWFASRCDRLPDLWRPTVAFWIGAASTSLTMPAVIVSLLVHHSDFLFVHPGEERLIEFAPVYVWALLYPAMTVLSLVMYGLPVGASAAGAVALIRWVLRRRHPAPEVGSPSGN